MQISFSFRTGELDVAFVEGETTISQALRNLTAGTTAESVIVQERGPGGGWPVCRFSGSLKDLATVLWRYHAPQESDGNLQDYLDAVGSLEMVPKILP